MFHYVISNAANILVITCCVVRFNCTIFTIMMQRLVLELLDDTNTKAVDPMMVSGEHCPPVTRPEPSTLVHDAVSNKVTRYVTWPEATTRRQASVRNIGTRHSQKFAIL